MNISGYYLRYTNVLDLDLDLKPTKREMIKHYKLFNPFIYM